MRMPGSTTISARAGSKPTRRLLPSSFDIRHSSFIPHHSSFHCRRAFTLIELVVAVGILGILLVVAGSVFTLTLKSSGQANAVIEVSEELRTLEETLAADLRNVQPGRSIMVIQPNVIHGPWSRDELALAQDGGTLDAAAHDLSSNRDPEREHLEGGTLEHDLPCAYQLGFLTDRPATSYRDPEISGHTEFVLYGHAQVGALARDGRWAQDMDAPATAPYPYFDTATYRVSDATLKFIASGGGRYELDKDAVENHNAIFPVAAQDWHLARRAVIVVDRDLPSGFYPAASLNDSAAGLSAAGAPVNDNEPRYQSAGLASEDYIRDGRRDYIVNKSPGFDYETDVADRQDRSDDRGWYAYVRNPATDTDPNDVNAVVNWMRRTQLAADPTADQADRLGAYFLPHCASFKVEWALDLSDFDFGACRMPEMPGAQSTIWVDPANFAQLIVDLQDAIDNPASAPGCPGPVFQDKVMQIRNRLVPHDPTYGAGPNWQACLAEHDPSRFVDPGGPSGTATPEMRSTHIFYPKKPRPSCFESYIDPNTGEPYNSVIAPPEVPDPLFPKALRITVDVYDPANRLPHPIRHVMVLPVGQD